MRTGRIYEWTLTQGKQVIRQGIVFSSSKDKAHQYVISTFSEDERKVWKRGTLTIQVLKIKET